MAPSLEEVEQARRAGRPLELVRLVDTDHRLPAALGSESVSRARGFLLLGEQLLVGSLPLGLRNDWRKIHRCLLERGNVLVAAQDVVRVVPLLERLEALK